MKNPAVNPVAKHAHKFNRAKVFRDKLKDYCRKVKHKHRGENDE